MPSFTFLIASLLFSHLTTRGRAEAVSYPIPDNDLQRHCSFNVNGYAYNLCPLLGSSEAVIVKAPEVLTESKDRRLSSGRYVLALGGVGKENDLVKAPGCNEGTWVCLTSKFSLPPHISWTQKKIA
jgi:hypothetical protein